MSVGRPDQTVQAGRIVFKKLGRKPQTRKLSFTGAGGDPLVLKVRATATRASGKTATDHFEDYYNGMGLHTRHLLMSVSKSVVGMLAGIIVAEGRLRPDAMIVDYLPEMVSTPGFAEATVRDVLDMTTAIVFSEDYDDPEAEVVTHEQATAWRGRTPLAEKGLYAYSQTIKKDTREHGELHNDEREGPEDQPDHEHRSQNMVFEREPRHAGEF